MAKRSRIPKTLSHFDTYIRTVVPFLSAGGSPSNGIRLGLDAVEITQAQGYLNQWYTGIPATPGFYELHTNPNTKTKTTRKQVLKVIADFSTFFQPLLTRMNGSASITASDRQIFNIAPPSKKHTTSVTQITEPVYFIGRPLGGGDVQFTCRSIKDSKRASKPKDADAVELIYKVGEPPLTGPDDPTAKRMISTKAHFILRLGAAAVGLKVTVCARWINTKHPNLSGSFGMVETIVVS